MKTVLIGILGSKLDHYGQTPRRWKFWRPSLSICMHDDLMIHEYHLLYEEKFEFMKDTICEDIQTVSPGTKVMPHKLSIENAWDFEEVYGALHDFSRTLKFDPAKKEYLVNITTGTHVFQICLYLLTETRYFPGKLLQISPPDKKNKDDNKGLYSLIDLDLSKYDKIASRFRQQISDDIEFLKSGIKTRNKQFNKLISRIEHVARHSNDPILLTGPTGAGKSHLAGRIYELKKNNARLTGSFVEINCATLRGDAAMSALFGHKKGSFTGAVNDRPGLLKTGDRGLVFLDEVGELGLDEQAMLLRAIEEKRFLPVGADKEITSDFQLICGTNKDLIKAIQKGEFREDLFARINLWTFRLPGLIHRPEDIEPNIEYEITRFSAENNSNITISPTVKNYFLKFAASPEALWKGNFRDLNAAIRRMGTMAAGGRITRPLCDEEFERLKGSWGTREDDVKLLIEAGIDPLELDLFDKIQLKEVLKICRASGSLSEAGRKLFAVSRKQKQSSNDADRLRKYLARFNLTWEQAGRRV